VRKSSSVGLLEVKGGIVTGFFVAILTALLLASMLALASPAQAKLQSAGPVDPSNGFPFWYQDESGTRLDLCLPPDPNQKCLQPFEMPNPDQPLSFPDNFPGEAFWWSAEADLSDQMPNSDKALLVLAQEAAFANEVPKDGDQMSFGRVRIRVDGLQIGQKYRVTHPYGVDEFVAVDDGDGGGEIDETEDIGCFPTPQTPCNFDEASSSRIGPFLTWDTFGGANDDPALRGANGEPNAYVGDPNIPHAVKGSPYGTNIFKVERLNADGTVATQLGSTNQFAVSGKVSRAQVGISPAETLFNADQDVTMTSSDPSVDIRYTMADAPDTTPPPPADPTGNSTLYNGPITLTADPDTKKTYTIKAAPFDSAGNQRGEVVTKTYTIDKVAPHLTADPPSKVSETPLDVALSANDPEAKIYYTLDGSTAPTAAIDAGDPAASKTFLYSGPIHVSRSTTIHAIAVDAAGNQSRVESFSYQIASLAQTGPIDPSNGFPSWYEDANGTRLDLCLNPQDQKCLQPFEMPDPNAPVSFPDNFPGEAFWWSGEAQTTTTNGSDALLVLAQEAAFANEVPKDGDQMSFGRVRVRVDGLVAGEKYKVTHPYGVDEFVAEPVVDGSTVGEINYTEDIGCFPTPQTPCNFDDARFSRIGPFLTWDTFGGANDDPALRGANGEPNAYVGDPNIPHAVKGSPYGTNIFKVERLNADGTATQVASTDQFALSGKVSNPANQPQPPTAPTDLALAADSNSGDPADSLTNDTTPTINGTAEAGVSVDILADGQVVGSGTAAADGSFSITTSVLAEGNHSIAAVAKNGELASAQSGSIPLTIDTTSAVVSASPAPGTYQTAQSVTLSTGDAADKIYYTTNGSEPTTSSTLYSAPIAVANTQTIRAIAVDAAGNQSASAPFAYTINITITAPGAPTIGTATAGNASATVNWTPPANNGGRAITEYRVRVYNSAGTLLRNVASIPGDATSAQVTNLTNGTAYKFKVQASNTPDGQTNVWGAESAFSNTVTPTAGTTVTLPGAPTIGTAASGVTTDGTTISATATWSPPTNTGGGAITGYRVKAIRYNSQGQLGTNQPANPFMTAGASARQLEFTGGPLTQGALYKFEVQASNTPAGQTKVWGPASAQSNTVTAR
jgi:Chitobiase/beta-hexosaminidase C-terminal domain/Fibronectin type III domain/Bacterial Ig-like domain/Fn3 associated